MDLSSPPPRDGPLTFHHLPLELKLEVIKLLYGSHDASVTPIMTPDAAWVNPCHLGMIGNRLAAQEPTREEIPVTCATDAEQPPLKSLRLVSREYYDICTPLLYRQLDLEVALPEVHENIATYGKYVRYIRIYIAGGVGGPWWDNAMHTLAKIVAECRLATTVAIYYNNGTEPDFGPLATEVVRMVESAQVTQIGIYSAKILRAKGGSRKWALRASSSPMQLLKALLLSPEACQALLRLDIVLEDLSIECFELLRRNLQSLKSLTVRKAFRLDRLSEIWNPGETYWWVRSGNLTRLVLIGCARPGAKHLVGLVACFPALRHLIWSSSGTSKDPTPPLPEDGWSDDSKIQLSGPNLEMLHIEHALEWELCWLGLISAETVMVLHFDETRLANALDRGVEMFLGMEKLRVLPPWNPEYLEPRDIRGRLKLPRPNGRNLDDICAERGVRLSRDGRLLEVYGERVICCVTCYNQYVFP